MNAQHTPGPWRLDNLAANGEQEIGISRSWENGGASICSVDSSRNAKTLLADARLIAAAPELLEALEDLIASASPTEKEHPRMFAAWQQARAALTKAKGGNQ